MVRNNDNNSTYQESQPCIYCQDVLIRFNFKNVIYSNNDGNYTKIRVRDLKSTHYSRAQKLLNIDDKVNIKRFLKK